MLRIIKLFFIAVAVLIAGLVLIVCGSYLIARYNEKELNLAKTEGEAFGKTSDNYECLTEALKRANTSSGISGPMITGEFTSRCFNNSRYAPGFCDDVPGELDVYQSAKWKNKMVTQKGLSRAAASQVYHQMQKYCCLYGPNRGK